MVSLLGMALGVASLIVVLSIMNGFGDELRRRILSVVTHATAHAESGPLRDWQPLAERLEADARVLGAAPFVAAKVLLESRGSGRGAQLLGIEPGRESRVSALGERMLAGRLDSLERRRWGIVLGELLARSLDVRPGDRVQLIAPVLVRTPLGSMPRRKFFEVTGIFSVGAQHDGSHALIRLRDAQALLGRGAAVDGLRLAFEDLFAAADLAAALAATLPAGVEVTPWQRAQHSLFSAVRMEKNAVAVLLLAVVAVAAFNIISTLTMAVTEKRSDIAVLRAMGASRPAVMAIFVCQGMALALAGIAIGVLGGCLLAWNISELAGLVERSLGAKLFDPRVYFISHLPARLVAADVAAVAALAAGLGFSATLVPAWRAAGIDPAEILRHE